MSKTRKRYNMGNGRRGYKQRLIEYSKYGNKYKCRRGKSQSRLDMEHHDSSPSWESSGLPWMLIYKLWNEGKAPNEIFAVMRKRGMRPYEINYMIDNWFITNHLEIDMVGVVAITEDKDMGLWRYSPLGSYNVAPAFKLGINPSRYNDRSHYVFCEGKLYRSLAIYELKPYVGWATSLKQYVLIKDPPLKLFPNKLLTPIIAEIVEMYIQSEFEDYVYYVSGWIKGTLRIRNMMYE